MKYFDEYARLGFYLFPVSREKIPFYKFFWKEKSSINKSQWESWENEYPGCSWAIDCEKSNLIVVDLDPRHGGFESWEEVLETFPQDLPHTIEVDTGGGGRHIYFRGLTSSKIDGKSGIDIKSIGGYVVCPESGHPSGKTYQFKPGYEPSQFIDIPDCPSFLFPQVQTKRKLRKRPRLKPGEKVPEGTRDDDLFTEICHAILRDKLYGEDLKNHAHRFNVEHYGLPEATVARKILSALSRYKNLEPFDDPFYMPFNDSGNAERLWFWFQDDFIYTNRGWWTWNGKKWEKDAEGTFWLAIAKKFQELRDMAKEKEEGLVKEEKKAAQGVTSYFNQCCNVAKIKNMVDLARAKFFEADDIFDADPWLFNTESGVFDLKKGLLRQSVRADFITKTCGYSPEINQDCQNFKKLILDAMDGDTEKSIFLTKILGSSLSGCVKDQLIILNHGTGNNGKTTLFETIMLKLMGDYGKDINVNTFLESKNNSGGDRPRPDLVRLIGVRYGTMAEPEKGKRLDSSLIKRLAGGGTITERDLHIGYVSWKSQLHLFMSFNDEPSLSDFSYGMRRRLAFIEWPVNFKRDDSFESKVIEEIPAILTYLVKACIAWQSEPLAIPESVSSATQDYMDNENKEARWLRDCVKKLPSEYRLTATLKACYESYVEWCEENNEKGMLTRNRFSKAIKNLGIKVNPHKGMSTTFLDIEILKIPPDSVPSEDSKDVGDFYWKRN